MTTKKPAAAGAAKSAAGKAATNGAQAVAAGKPTSKAAASSPAGKRATKDATATPAGKSETRAAASTPAGKADARAATPDARTPKPTHEAIAERPAVRPAVARLTAARKSEPPARTSPQPISGTGGHAGDQEAEPTTIPLQAPRGESIDDFGGSIGVGSARTIRAPWRSTSVVRTRAAVVADLEARGVNNQVVDESAIVVSELVANSLRHGSPLHDNTVRVHWTEKGGVVEIEVTDGGGATTPKPFPLAVFASSGRGLRIVRSLAHEWGVTEKRAGVTVWASLGGPSRRRA